MRSTVLPGGTSPAHGRFSVPFLKHIEYEAALRRRLLAAAYRRLDTGYLPRKYLLRRRHARADLHGVAELLQRQLKRRDCPECVERVHVAHVREADDPALEVALAAGHLEPVLDLHLFAKRRLVHTVRHDHRRHRVHRIPRVDFQPQSHRGRARRRGQQLRLRPN